MLASAPRGAGCVVLAAFRYYFWLCCFAWMTAMAQDVWRAFRLSHTQLRVAGGAETRRFLVYSLCCWLVPAAPVALVVALDQLEPRGVPEAFLPRLGHPWCWFSQRKSLLVFLAAPVALLIVMNVVFFATTAVLIAGLSRGAATAARASASLRRQRYCSVVRLAAVMGLAWVTAILAPHLQWEPLWYLSVILTSLQGVFIFLAFTCRATVLQEVRARAPTLLQRTATLITRRPPPPAPAVSLDHLHSDQDVSSSTL
uniref:G-protein coupled receptors family 2 profile 2 domain-containing protein n=1 Tax=Scylla olivacea TaxID=85551 RepID=A0A0P4VRL7_SCYOL